MNGFVNLLFSFYGGVSGLANIGSLTCFLLSRRKARNLLKSADSYYLNKTTFAKKKINMQYKFTTKLTFFNSKKKYNLKVKEIPNSSFTMKTHWVHCKEKIKSTQYIYESSPKSVSGPNECQVNTNTMNK